MYQVYYQRNLEIILEEMKNQFEAKTESCFAICPMKNFFSTKIFVFCRQFCVAEKTLHFNLDMDKQKFVRIL